MTPLDVLPVFFDLKGKRVLVAGGEEAAAWKAELMAAAGATVTVVAQSFCEEMVALETRGAVQLVDGDWRQANWAGLALAIGDCSDNQAAEFVAIARAHGVPVNVIDKPEHCQFQFGSIVNRSPLVVGISTSGAAPILGQAVRRRIETLLPKTLSAWARLAQSLRATVLDRLAPGAERRAFWEQFTDLSFSGNEPAGDPAAMMARASHAPSGRVTLVGAGPGDAEYLTLKAVRALQSADVILFDDLVSDEVLELARREARRILVGKRARRASCRQDDINSMMADLARKGRHVVRLKSGDPMLFGRAGEEIAALEAQNISVSVVPGISTAFALAAELGISLTHRDCAQSVRFVTGHARNGQLPENLDWGALSDPATTHVYYMSGATAPRIAEKLLARGMDRATPVLIASNVGRPNREIIRCRLDGLAHEMEGRNFSGPVITAIGHAFGQRLAPASSPAIRPETLGAFAS
ncbi:siroheme synthase / precorrin-2 oxidase / sirohydrochlorin ferrochelatase / uroporphyrinogen-III methyltransferase [Pelagibacterium halotolerans B2]|uniref:Siroheme synthase / precorrin-2 oxidase / sirohydrochlorin ferrochelatase / uroporphyrinogen-III methyltransferase n=2 Tax=Pelagibacterium TaxID=1082930 RepID=G4R891_PELHB|nr:siroheme synthase / precorrin-2 oxidase / sirohydrochlorin ferrochelatase / uroporphyrinogen-III methyltransferase [Pelagibacterium halotolerans B2]